MSRYGVDWAGNPNGCPEGMYPWDVDYAEDRFQTFDQLREAATFDSLNLPISWDFKPADEGGEFVLVYVMPRKNGKTWSMTLAAGYDRTEVEDWLEARTREVAAKHYGWTNASPTQRAVETISPEIRAVWRRDACVEDLAGRPIINEHTRIIALLDALEAAEASQT